ncbi:hypothetical protein NMG60_11020604 [Bertholletia excelsa]
MASSSTFIRPSPVLPQRPSCAIGKAEQRRGRRLPAPILAARNEAHGRDYWGGRLVDESMIILRKRIHEMKMIERNYEPPSHWSDWEKSCYAGYDAFICEAVGLLQSQLMNTRPSLALGVMALVMMSVPTSVALLLLHAVGVTQGVLSGIHLG